MASEKIYFILRTQIYHPDDYIQLGQVITDQNAPYKRLAPPAAALLTPPYKPRISKQGDWVATNTKTDTRSRIQEARLHF